MTSPSDPSDDSLAPEPSTRDLEMVAFAWAQATPTNVATPPSFGRTLPPRSPPGYLISHELHRGGQGVVYFATELATGKDVAIKVIHDRDRRRHADARFAREVETLTRLRHPRIVAIRDAGEVDGSSFYVMEHIAGSDLDVYLREHDRSLAERTQLCRDIADAVAAAHSIGILHRDLKPANIRVDVDHQPHLLDFGLARDVDTPRAIGPTETGAFVGSTPWASPEQVTGSTEQITLATDVYALGVIFYEILTGGRPYDTGGSTHRAFEAILHAEPVPPRRVNPAIGSDLNAIVLKCLSKEPARRYGSAGELATDLHRAAMGMPISARRDQTAYVIGRMLRRNPTVATLAAIVGLLVIGFSLHLVHNANRLAQLLDENVIARRELDAALTARELDSMRLAYDQGDHPRLTRLISSNHAVPHDPMVGFFRGILRREIATLRHNDAILAALFLPDGSLLTGSWSGSLRWYDRDGNRTHQRDEVCVDIRALGLHGPSGHLVVVGSEGVLILDPVDGSPLVVLSVPSHGIDRVSVSARHLLAATPSGLVFEWPLLETGFPERATPTTWACTHADEDLAARSPSTRLSGVDTLLLDAARQTIYSAGEGRVNAWRLQATTPVSSLIVGSSKIGPETDVVTLAIRDDGNELAVATHSNETSLGALLFIDLTSLAITRRVPFVDSYATAVAYGPHGRLFASDGKGRVRVFDRSGRVEAPHLLPSLDRVERVVVGPTPPRLLTISPKHRSASLLAPDGTAIDPATGGAPDEPNPRATILVERLRNRVTVTPTATRAASVTLDVHAPVAAALLGEWDYVAIATTSGAIEFHATRAGGYLFSIESGLESIRSLAYSETRRELRAESDDGEEWTYRLEE